MRAVHMNVDPVDVFRIDIPSDMASFFDNQTSLSVFSRFISKSRAVKSRPNYQIIILLHSRSSSLDFFVSEVAKSLIVSIAFFRIPHRFFIFKHKEPVGSMFRRNKKAKNTLFAYIPRFYDVISRRFRLLLRKLPLKLRPFPLRLS